MKIEVLMYVRFKDKRNVEYIRQITEIPKDNRYASIYIDRETNYSKGLSFKNVLKASHNIIDLIEEDDFINEMRVNEIKEKTNEYIKFMADSDYEFITTLYKNQIKSIVTKEQFESMKYEVK